MRLTQIKLAGFKSFFVDPTGIATPGQLVGIVGPNGCGKSNVIDAVRWVLGESKASALRGDSMQDVIFNGAGGAKLVGRASVELFLHNSAGRIGGQWGQYAEASIKRVLTRDSGTHRITSTTFRCAVATSTISSSARTRPARVRDHRAGHDFAGDRGQAGGIARVPRGGRGGLQIQGAAQGNRRAACGCPREPFPRRGHPNRGGHQLEKLEAQAKVAGEYREHETRLKLVQHLLWFSRQQDAVNARERHLSAIAGLTVAFERPQPDVRATEARLEALRADHDAAGDAMHEKQGAFYETNAEVTRLEQQLAFARESETRITQQVAQLTEQIGALGGQETGLVAERTALETAIEDALSAREKTEEEERAANAALPELEQAVARAAAVYAEQQQGIALAEQAIRVIETRRENLTGVLEQLAQRRSASRASRRALSHPSPRTSPTSRSSCEPNRASSR